MIQFRLYRDDEIERMKDHEELVYIPEAKAIHMTARAVLCQMKTRTVWVPRSQIDGRSGVRNTGDSGVLIITKWWWKKRNSE